MYTTIKKEDAVKYGKLRLCYVGEIHRHEGADDAVDHVEAAGARAVADALRPAQFRVGIIVLGGKG